MSDCDLAAAIIESDARHRLLPKGTHLVIGISGGPDSVALARALLDLSAQRDLTLHLAHLDHMLREGSSRDAAFVAHLARHWGLPISVAARDVRALAADTGRSLEDAARAARYAYLATVAAAEGANTVAVGHHADDQAETVLMNLLRGSGLDGLKGMTPSSIYPLSVSEIAALEDVAAVAADEAGWPPKLIRPLLGVNRKAIEAYLDQAAIEALDDMSNRDAGFLRNRVRHEIVPLLESVNPRLREALARAAAALADDAAFLDAEADRAWRRCLSTEDPPPRLSMARWRALPPALQRRLLRRAVSSSRSRREFGWEHIEALRLALLEDRSPSGLPGGLTLWRDGESFALGSHGIAIPPARLSSEPVSVPVPGAVTLPGGWQMTTELRARRADDLHSASDGWSAAMDAAAAGGELAVRGRKPGDRIEPLGMAGRHKSIQDLFVDQRVPRSERAGWPLLVAGEQILWVPGVRLAEAVRLRHDSRQVLVVKVQPPARLRRAMA